MKKFLSAWWYLLFIIILFTTVVSCTKNQRVKHFGGTWTITLPQNQKLIVATWKDTNLWYMYRPIRENENPETLTFQEDSSFGILNGKVIFVENK